MKVGGTKVKPRQNKGNSGRGGVGTRPVTGPKPKGGR
jgi:hypothetical protein